MSNEVKLSANQDAKNIGVLNWVGTLFFGFIPCLILYLVKQDDAFVTQHSKEALNWSITVFIVSLIGSATTFILIGFLILLAIGICHLVFTIMGTLAAFNGKPFSAPFCIRLLK